MNNKKKLMIAGASSLAFAMVGLGAYAYFNDSESLLQSSTVGTVNVEVAGGLTHSGATFGADGSIVNPGLDNLNPGDNDPTVNDGYRFGTDHQLSFTVNNEGSKSLMTRTIIKVYGTDKTGKKLPVAALRNVIISERVEYNAAPDADDRDKKQDLVDPITEYKTVEQSLIYTVGGTSNGYALSADPAKFPNAETEYFDANKTNAIPTSISKTFDIGLSRTVTSDSPLMGATIYFDVIVQAMQYRNTGDGAWEEVFAQTYTAGGSGVGGVDGNNQTWD